MYSSTKSKPKPKYPHKMYKGTSVKTAKTES